MSFRDCILGKVTDGKLDKSKADSLISKFDKRVEAYKARGYGEDAASVAAEDMLSAEAKRIEKNQSNLRRHALKQKEWNDKYNAMPGRIEAKVSDTLQNAAWRTEGVAKEAYALLNDVADKLKVNMLGTNRDYATVEKAVRSLLGETVDDPEAAKLGQAMTNVFDYLHARYEQAGGNLGKIEKYFPQFTRREAIIKMKVSQKEWVDYTLPKLDRARMIDEDTGLPFETPKLIEVMNGVYDSIMSAGKSDMAKLSREGKMLKGKARDVDMRHSDSRFLQFKSPNDFMEYNGTFGSGPQGLAETLFQHIQSMSRDIGVMEYLGPKPNAMFKFMDFKMGAEGESAVKRKWAQAEYRVLTSSFQHGDIDAMWWRMFTGTQNWLRSAKLGAASISALGDPAFMMGTAKANGLSATRSMGFYAKNLNPLDGTTRGLAKRSGFIAQSLGGAALGDTRFAGEAMGAGITKVLANMTNELSGLQKLTRTTQDAISLEGMATLGDHVAAKAKWADVDEFTRKGLERFGFDESHWDDLLKTEAFDQGDAKFIISSELRTDKSLPAARAKEIADKIDDWTYMMRQMAANEPSLATRALTTGAILGDGGLATPSRVVGATLGLFKSYPITVVMSHLMPAINSIKKNPTRLRSYDHLAMVAIGGTLLGAVSMQAKELVKGKSPKDMGDGKFWRAAFLQGGGAGLFGDFFFGDYSRFDRTPLSEALGPTVGLFEDIMKVFSGNLEKAASDEKTNFFRDAFKVAKGNIPMGSLWYSRLAVERLVLDNVERLIDPNFDRRIGKYERKMRKETEQEFWWRPGQTRPK